MNTTASSSCSAPATGGRLALAGRALLRREMTTPAPEPTDPAACTCVGCCPSPLTDIEAQRALRHVSNIDAAAFARGELALIRYESCAYCEAWVPIFGEI